MKVKDTTKRNHRIVARLKGAKSRPYKTATRGVAVISAISWASGRLGTYYSVDYILYAKPS